MSTDDDVDPVELRRSIGYIVQEAGLFPHMTAVENVCIVPSLLNWPIEKQTARAKELFGAEHANVQPHSGAQANMAVYLTAVKPGDTVMGLNLDHGGHLTHGHPLNFSGKLFKIVPINVDKETETIDYEEAERLAREILIVDTHVDVPYRLFEEMEDISVRTGKGDFDYPRAKAGGLDAAFMSIYVPAKLEDDGAKERAEVLIDMVEKFEADWPEKFAVARSRADVEAAFAAGKVALPMGMENGAPIEGDLDNLRYFADRGIRYITLTHSKNNHICDSSYDEEKG